MIKRLTFLLLASAMLLLSSCDADSADFIDTYSGTETAEPHKAESSAPETEPQTEPETTFEETTVPDTTAEETTASEETSAETVPETEPETAPVQNGGEYIGSLYTVDQLNSFGTSVSGYGPGVNVDENNRPYGAINCQKMYQDFNVAFIAPQSDNVYLTFDLGYENGYTSKILDTLKEKDVKAVFFATLSYCKSNPDIVARIINEGHVLGNHSVSHLSMPTLSLEKMESEIMDMHNYILQNYGYTMTLFRPPMGEFSNQSLAVTQSLGYKTVHWSFAYYDYDTANQPEYSAALAKVTNAAHGGAIYLLHAVSSTNAAILGEVIDNLRSQGYTPALFG